MNSTDSIKKKVRNEIWNKLRKFALPDSRFDWDFSSYIPDFFGSEICNNNIRGSQEYQDAQVVFITPDNCLELLRKFAIEDKKELIISTYGIKRDFIYIPPGSISECDKKLAATLDGMEHLGSHMSISNLENFKSINLLVTGASAITPTGIRWGKGHGYFDLEWGMFRECGLVSENTPIFALGHDCQVVDLDIEISKYDTIVDRIFTPTQTININSKLPKPSGIFWGLVTKEQIESIPSLNELYPRI